MIYRNYILEMKSLKGKAVKYDYINKKMKHYNEKGYVYKKSNSTNNKLERRN